LKNELAKKKLRNLTTALKMGLSSYYLKGDDEVVKIINTKDLENGIIKSDSIDSVLVKKTPLLEKSRIEARDLIVTTKGTNFKAAVADQSVANSVISANLIAIKLSNEVQPDIVAAYLNSSRGQRDLQALSSGSSIQGLNANSLLEIQVPIPPLPEQKWMVNYLSLATEYNRLLKRELELRVKLADTIITKIYES
jgi:type I restriction enzyme, S subunit